MTAKTLRALFVVVLIVFTVPTRAHAHPVPFSYVDARIESTAIDVTLVVHVYDVAHDLQIDSPERLLDPALLAERSQAVASLLTARMHMSADGETLAPAETAIVAMPE